MTLDAPDEYVSRIFVSKNLEMRVETVAVHIYMKASPLALGTNSYFTASNLGTHWKNCVVRDQRVYLPLCNYSRPYCQAPHALILGADFRVQYLHYRWAERG